MTWDTLNEFLISPIIPSIPLSRGLLLFTLFLLAIRILPEFARKLTLLLTCVALIELATSPFYTFLFVAYSGVLYYALFWLQWSRHKKIYCGLLAFATVTIFFLLKDVPALETPWTGQAVHYYGVAYSLFRLLSVIFEVGRGTPLPTDPLDYFVYQFFVPTFFQGPIERLHSFKENLGDPEKLDLRDLGSQGIRILTGAVKMWCVFHYFTLDWKSYFDYPQQFSYGYLVWGMYARALSFYLFTSAANDFTISCCAIAGYRLHENFDYPYFKRNLAQFWRSWHMTLTSFARDYIYIPLGGNKKRVYLNYLIVFMAIALWHVASPAFVIWGLWHGLGMCGLRLWQNFWKRREGSEGVLASLQLWSRSHPRLTAIASGLFTFHYVALSWLPFWGGHPQGLSMILRLLSGNHWKLFIWE